MHTVGGLCFEIGHFRTFGPQWPWT